MWCFVEGIEFLKSGITKCALNSHGCRPYKEPPGHVGVPSASHSSLASPPPTFDLTNRSTLFHVITSIMRFSTIAFTLFGAAASASASSLFARQDTLPGEPNAPSGYRVLRLTVLCYILLACAIPCTTSANLGGCVATDTQCLCTNTAFVSSTTTCVQTACTGADLAAALKFSVDLCLKVVRDLFPTMTRFNLTSRFLSSGCDVDGWTFFCSLIRCRYCCCLCSLRHTLQSCCLQPRR